MFTVKNNNSMQLIDILLAATHKDNTYTMIIVYWLRTRVFKDKAELISEKWSRRQSFENTFGKYFYNLNVSTPKQW